jgi:hypothetical protein
MYLFIIVIPNLFPVFPEMLSWCGSIWSKKFARSVGIFPVIFFHHFVVRFSFNPHFGNNSLLKQTKVLYGVDETRNGQTNTRDVDIRHLTFQEREDEGFLYKFLGVIGDFQSNPPRVYSNPHLRGSVCTGPRGYSSRNHQAGTP